MAACCRLFAARADKAEGLETMRAALAAAEIPPDNLLPAFAATGQFNRALWGTIGNHTIKFMLDTIIDGVRYRLMLEPPPAS